MNKISSGKKCFVLVEVPKDSMRHKISMGYLLLTVPAYENWVTDAEIMEAAITGNFEQKGEDFKQGMPIKLPDNIEDDSFLGLYNADKGELDFEINDNCVESIIIDNKLYYRNYGESYTFEGYKNKLVNKLTVADTATESLLSLFKTLNLQGTYAVLINI